MRKELGKINSSEPKKADNCLDKSIEVLEKWHKHIKVTDRSDFSWATVQHYDNHPLTLDSDEKQFEKAE